MLWRESRAVYTRWPPNPQWAAAGLWIPFGPALETGHTPESSPRGASHLQQPARGGHRLPEAAPRLQAPGGAAGEHRISLGMVSW